MELTQDEALSLLRSTAARIAEARALVSDLEDSRDRIVAHFDGQEGMTRARMAEALSMSVPAVQRMVATHRPAQEAEAQPVTVPDSLRQQLEALDVLDLPAASSPAKKAKQNA